MPRVVDQRAWQEDLANFDAPVTFQAGFLTKGGPWQDVKAWGAKGDGVTDDSAAIQTAANNAAGGMLLFSPGNYKITANTITLSANTLVYFFGATITVGAALSNGVFAVSVVDVMVDGNLKAVGGSFQSPFWRITSGGDRFQHRAKVNVSGIAHGTGVNDPNFYLYGTSTNRLLVGGGLITSTDSLLLKTDRCNGVSFADVDAGPYTSTNGSNPIVCIGDLAPSAGAATGFTGAEVRNVRVDGGNQIAGYAPIVVAQFAIAGFTNPGAQVRIVDCEVRNTLSNSDGIDVVLCNQVAVTNCHTNSVLNGIDIAGCNEVTVNGCTGVTNRGPAVQIGDLTVPDQTNLATVTGCVGVDCGSSGSGATAADFITFAPASQSTNVVRWQNCIGFKSNVAANLYGFGITNGVGGTFSGIEVDNGFLLGNTAGFLDSSTNAPNVVLRNVSGVNPRAGGVNTPGFPLTTVAQANSTGSDVQVAIVAGAAAVAITIAGKAMGSIPASGMATFVLPAGNSITPTYASGSPSWAWFGL